MSVTSCSSNKRVCTSQNKLKCTAKYSDLNWRLLSIVVTYLNFEEILKFYRSCKHFKDIRFLAVAINVPTNELGTARQNMDHFLDHLLKLASHDENPDQELRKVLNLGNRPTRDAVIQCCLSACRLQRKKKISNETVDCVVKFIKRALPKQLLCYDQTKNSGMQRVMYHALKKPDRQHLRDFMLHCGLNINLPYEFDGRDVSLLTHFTIKENVEAITYLLEQGADANGEGNDNDKTPLHYCARQFGNLEIAKILLDYRINAGIVLESNGNGVLHEVVKYGNHAMIPLLTSRDHSFMELINDSDHTPLMDALARNDHKKNDTKSVELLLEAGSDPNDANSTTTPLILACNTCNVTNVKLLLLANANVNQATDFGVTPLLAAAKSTAEILEIIIIAGAFLNVQDHDGNTALHHATKGAFTEAFKLAKEGKSMPEILFMRSASLDIMLTLLRFKPDYSVENNSGERPLQFARVNFEDSPAKRVATSVLLFAVKYSNLGVVFY